MPRRWTKTTSRPAMLPSAAPLKDRLLPSSLPSRVCGGSHRIESYFHALRSSTRAIRAAYTHIPSKCTHLPSPAFPHTEFTARPSATRDSRATRCSSMLPRCPIRLASRWPFTFRCQTQSCGANWRIASGGWARAARLTTSPRTCTLPMFTT